MKKFSIITLFLALLCTTMQAQENTYNMVIEMTDGTKITIGPNDIRNLTFNNGELTVTGESLQEWMESVAKKEDVEKAFVFAIDVDERVESFLAPLKEYFGIDSYWDASKVGESIIDEIIARKDFDDVHDEMITDLKHRMLNLEAELYNLKSQLGN
mgnify:CR=1 FL=1